MLEKDEPQANASRTSGVLLKSQVLYIAQEYTINKFSISFRKCIVNCAHSGVLMTQAA